MEKQKVELKIQNEKVNKHMKDISSYKEKAYNLEAQLNDEKSAHENNRRSLQDVIDNLVKKRNKKARGYKKGDYVSVVDDIFDNNYQFEYNHKYFNKNEELTVGSETHLEGILIPAGMLNRMVKPVGGISLYTSSGHSIKAGIDKEFAKRWEAKELKS